jgi:hypothetical protein
MRKLADTITNESRQHVIDKNHAGFRANKLEVIKIINMNRPEETRDYVSHNFMGTLTEYRVGHAVVPDNYDTDVDAMCSWGIHYYRTPETAYFYDKDTKQYTGIILQWYVTGQLSDECTYNNGIQDGIETRWFMNGHIMSQGNRVNGRKEGMWTYYWDQNKQKRAEGCYKNGQKYGKWMYADENEQIKTINEDENPENACGYLIIEDIFLANKNVRQVYVKVEKEISRTE